MQRWQILSLVLAIVLAGSFCFFVYRSLNVSNGPRVNWYNDLLNIVLNSTSTTNYTWLNFTFTWGSDAQRIVQGEFRLKVNIGFYTHYSSYGDVEEMMLVVVGANDDEYDEWDYIGLVFDNNQNGYIDTGDKSYGLFANNMTQPSALFLNGFLGFAEVFPGKGPHIALFDSGTGYTYFVCTPLEAQQSLKKGYNPLHVCYYDVSDGGVFIRFSFHIPEE